MKEIFEHIEGGLIEFAQEEWGQYGNVVMAKAYSNEDIPDSVPYGQIMIAMHIEHENFDKDSEHPMSLRPIYSLQSILIKKSLCRIIWGKDYEYHSMEAFKLLQQEGNDVAIAYIKETMV